MNRKCKQRDNTIKDDDVSLVTWNSWKTTEQQNRHCTGSPVKEEIKVVRASSGKIRSGELSNRLTRHKKSSVSRRWTEKNGRNVLSGVLDTVKTKVRGLANCVWSRWMRAVVPDVQVGPAEASCHRSFQVKDARSSEHGEAQYGAVRYLGC